ncbi:MAG: UDP-4-amino-4,6-dideoxy-N-acetyl-beta-L-altrosamine transaminase [Candidatus ainarchaeum sp.]|nr:UDP-4-amino-4,6-dideoxy-N-acetyl-beta-L-altrosamine transaminase [Candidatus ainarchaeum sp.]
MEEKKGVKQLPYGRQFIDDDDINAVIATLKSDWLTTGPKVDEFEKAICDYTGAKYAVAVNSGTSALDIAVAAFGLPAGSEIITTPFSFAASANCIAYNGCRPVFADIDPKTYNIDPEQVRKKITKKTKAIIYVDYAGQPCDIKALQEIAEEKNLFLIEDAAHALGAKYNGKKIGTFAHMTEFSFHPVKHITTGEGGAITTDDGALADKLRMLRNHGLDKSARERFGPDAGYAYDMRMLGRNYRITDMQCALGISQMKKLDRFIKGRRELVAAYGRELATLPLAMPYVAPNVESAWHLYTVQLGRGISRDKVFAAMRKRGVGVNVHYIPTYKFTYYKKNFPANDSDYPATEDVFSHILTLPLFYGMKEADVQWVAKELSESIREAGQ